MNHATDSDFAATSSTIEPAARPVRWYQKRRVVLPLLAVCYPLGLWLLVKAPRPGQVMKIFISVVFLLIFAIVALLAFKPYWQFAGGMSGLKDFSIDTDRMLRSPDARLEAHRSEQAAKGKPALPGNAVAGPAWTDFRGPRRDGVCRGERIRLDWSKHPPKEMWRQPVGGGHASFVVAEGMAFTIEQRRKQEVVTCYDVETGRELWAFAYDASFEETLGGNGPRATPTIHGDRLFSLGAQGHLHCLELRTGKRIWSTDILFTPASDADSSQKGKPVKNLEWGLSASPLVVDDIVMVTNSGKSGPSVFGYRVSDGKLVWQTEAGSQGYSSPMLATIDGVRQVLNLGGTELRGIDPVTGDVLWRHPWDTYMWINVAIPQLIGENRVFLSAAYDHGCALLEVHRDADKWQTKEIWFSKRMKNKFNTSVIHNGRVYGLDEAVLCCINLENGERVWKGGRYGYGSLLLVGDHLLVMSEQPADLILVKAEPKEHEELGRVRLFEERTWNNFVLVGGRLLARNDRWMACYDLSEPEADGEANAAVE